MICVLVLACAALSRAGEGERGTVLARVPAGLTIPLEMYSRNSRWYLGERSALAWSVDGRVVAYAGQGEKGCVPVVGAEVGATYDLVGLPVVAGGHVFFRVGRKKSDEREQHWLWIDGKTIGPEDWMDDELAVRADGKQVLVWTNPGARFGEGAVANGKLVLLAATEKGSQWSLMRSDDWFEIGPIRFGPGDQGAYSVAVERNKGWTVFKFGKREPRMIEPCEGIESFDVGPGGAFAYVRTRQYAGRVFLTEADEPRLFFGNRRIGAGHGIVSMATLDPSGAHVAYVVTEEKRRTVALDEEAAPLGEYDFVLEISFAPGGERLGFIAVRGGADSAEYPGLVQGGQWCAVVRDTKSGAEPREQPSFLEVRDLRWDARGERLAYCARDESGWHVVVGELKSAPHTDVGPPVFSADGATVGFGSRDADELGWRELDLR